MDSISGSFSTACDTALLNFNRSTPDLFKSFAVANALIDPVYRGHRMARLWATPVVGELMMDGMGPLPREVRDKEERVDGEADGVLRRAKREEEKGRNEIFS